MGQGMLHRLISVFMDISRHFRKGCDCKGIENLAILVHGIMSRRTRHFHTLEHVFGFVDGSDYLSALSAVFHDLVYYQVDNGLPTELIPLLDDYIDIRAGAVFVKPATPTDDKALSTLCELFGLQPGDQLKATEGLNEFLSALAMWRLMSAYLDLKQLVAVSVCIEASIPFRGPNEDGVSIGENLEQRLEAIRKAGWMAAEDVEIQGMVIRAIAFANDDVRDFSLPDPGHFLSNTWKLLPESNAALRLSNMYTIRDYLTALLKMRNFLASLSPGIIYHTYRGRPDTKTMSSLVVAAGRNLRWALDYFEAKILATGLLDAIASLTGGDAPVALFMGDLPAEGLDGEHLIDFLPGVPDPDWLDEDDVVYRLLKDGRLDESSFDLRNSPLALHLYLRLGPAFWKASCQAALNYTRGSTTADSFLDSLPKDVLGDLLEASASMVPTRRSLLKDMIGSIKVPA